MIVVFLVVFSSCIYISNENLLETFLPRHTAMHENYKLIFMHVVGDLIMGTAYCIIAYDLMKVYKSFSKYKMLWNGYFYMFSALFAFIMACKLFSALDMLVTFYWLEGLTKMSAAVIAGVVAYGFHQDQKKISAMKSPEEYNRIVEAYNKLVVEFNELNEHNTDYTDNPYSNIRQ